MSKDGPDYLQLLGAAQCWNDAPPGSVTLALAGVIALAPSRPPPYNVALAGLDRIALAALRDSFFPALSFSFLPDQLATGGAARSDVFDDLLALLLEHRTCDHDEARWLAHAVATACMGANHLWQDMGLPDRGALSWLMTHHFTTLAMRNAGDMKWKKFFYRQLCERAGLFICRSPSCGACVDHSQCFGPEDAGDHPVLGNSVALQQSRASA